MMKIKWGTGTAATGALLFVSGALSSPLAQASILLEPLLGGEMGKSNFMTASSATGSAVGGSMRLGFEHEDLFTTFEGKYTVGNAVAGGASGYLYSLGITAGGTFTYVPLRAWFGFDFMDSYSDSYVAVAGSAMRAGFGYCFSEHFVLNLQFTMHNFTGLTTQVTAPAAITAANLSSTTAVQYTTVGLSLSIPMSLEVPNRPWRIRHHPEDILPN